jgi:hypothetical protein
MLYSPHYWKFALFFTTHLINHTKNGIPPLMPDYVVGGGKNSGEGKCYPKDIPKFETNFNGLLFLFDCVEVAVSTSL